MIKENLRSVRERIAAVCLRLGRSSDSVALVCVSKGRLVEEIKEALDSGITDIGESRVQEAGLKYRQLSAIGYQLPAIKWHMLGHLQTNKVKDAVKLFDLIDSVDSLRLAVAINEEAARINKAQDILIEVKTSPEATKSGIKPDEAVEAVKRMSALKNINIKGLMTIAPLADNPEDSRLYFKILKDLFDRINKLATMNYQLSTISMGMSGDFEIAIEEGANMVRLGRAIFE